MVKILRKTLKNILFTLSFILSILPDFLEDMAWKLYWMDTEFRGPDENSSPTYGGFGGMVYRDNQPCAGNIINKFIEENNKG